MKIPGKLVFKINKASNLESNDMDIPDPYVKIFLNE